MGVRDSRSSSGFKIIVDGKRPWTTMENSKEENQMVSPSGSRPRRESKSPMRTPQRRNSERKNSNPFLETTLDWLRKLTPRKLQEYTEDLGEKRTEATSNISAETLIKKKKILTVHAEVNPDKGRTLNLYEAFGTTAKKTAPGYGFQPLLVVEVDENGMLKRHLVPYKYSMEGKWLLYGKQIYVLKGHSFVEHKSSPNFMSFLFCTTERFRMTLNFFQCTDCEYVCNYLQEATVKKDCPIARILTLEMNFPYDVIETKPEKVHYLRIS